MKIAAGLLLVALLVTPNAHALTQDWGGLENDWSMPTGTRYVGPIATACTAVGSAKQRCRACMDHHNIDGQPTGLKICAYVARSAACDCNLSADQSSCQVIGSCTYFQ